MLKKVIMLAGGRSKLNQLKEIEKMRKRTSIITSVIVLAVSIAATATAQEHQWTPWLNRDTPGGSGDYETLAGFLKESKACPEPTDIQCQSTDGKDWKEAGQEYVCETKNGGVCVNKEQQGGVSCFDYRVRFLCPGSALFIIEIHISWLTEPDTGAALRRRAAPQTWKGSVQAANREEVYRRLERAIMKKIREAAKPGVRGGSFAPGSITIVINW